MEKEQEKTRLSRMTCTKHGSQVFMFSRFDKVWKCLECLREGPNNRIKDFDDRWEEKRGER